MNELSTPEVLQRLSVSAHGYFNHVPGKDFSQDVTPPRYVEMAEDIFHIATRAGFQFTEADFEDGEGDD
jgi:hypothetical protein